MNSLSVVIISLNAEKNILRVISQAKKVSSDVVIVDSGSKDKTEQICRDLDVQFHSNQWLGYGEQKNFANTLAKHNWILSLDADEVLSDELVLEINQLDLKDGEIYTLPFLNSYCGQLIQFGRWRNEQHTRIFNRTSVSWNTKAVHEGLTIDEQKEVNLIHPVVHYSMASKKQHLEKANKYALMGATKLYNSGRKSNFIKQYFNPVFRFVMDYFVFLGFLDGQLGFQIAWITAKETYWKYSHLKNMG